MQPRTAICFGEALIDHHPNGTQVAGAPLHVAARLAALGWKTYLLTRIGDDAPGRRVLDTLSRCHVDTALVQIDSRTPTGSAVIREGVDGVGRFELPHPVAWDQIELPRTLPDHDVFYFGSLVGRNEVSRDSLFAAGEMSTAELKVCDINMRAPWVNSETTGWALRTATVLKCSDEELARLSARGPEHLLERHPQLEMVAVTLGEAGATLYRKGSATHGPAADVGVVDTVGAGDAFTAGLIDGLVDGGEDLEILARATAIAADAVSSPGGLPEIDSQP
jgi:fructokinase